MPAWVEIVYTEQVEARGIYTSCPTGEILVTSARLPGPFVIEEKTLELTSNRLGSLVIPQREIEVTSRDFTKPIIIEE